MARKALAAYLIASEERRRVRRIGAPARAKLGIDLCDPVAGPLLFGTDDDPVRAHEVCNSRPLPSGIPDWKPRRNADAGACAGSALRSDRRCRPGPSIWSRRRRRRGRNGRYHALPRRRSRDPPRHPAHAAACPRRLKITCAVASAPAASAAKRRWPFSVLRTTIGARSGSWIGISPRCRPLDPIAVDVDTG